MNKFPKKITIKVVEDEKKIPIPNIAISMKLYAKHKNNYNLIPPVSNNEGIINITKEWLEKEINKLRNLFIMDYASNLDDCDYKIRIAILSNDEIKKSVNGMKIYKEALNISDLEIESLLDARNKYYQTTTKIIEFNGESSYYLELNIKLN